MVPDVIDDFDIVLNNLFKIQKKALKNLFEINQHQFNNANSQHNWRKYSLKCQTNSTYLPPTF